MASQPQLCPRQAPLFSTTTLLSHTFATLFFAQAIFAQTILNAPETTSFSSPHPSLSATSTDPSNTITSLTESRSHTTLFRSTTSHNATAHNATTTTSRTGNLPLGPANGDGNGDAMQGPNLPSGGGGLLNYYFGFLAIFIVLLFSAVWYIHRRKKRLKALRASSRQTALNRDLDGWAGGRRWVGGAFRGGLRRQHERETSREEGLNELGEAPPPYKARDSVGSGPDTADPDREGEPPSEIEGAHPPPTIPLRTLDRDGRAVGKPPGYHETVQELPLEQAESSSAAQRHAFTRANTQDHVESGRS